MGGAGHNMKLTSHMDCNLYPKEKTQEQSFVELILVFLLRVYINNSNRSQILPNGYSDLKPACFSIKWTGLHASFNMAERAKATRLKNRGWVSFEFAPLQSTDIPTTVAFVSICIDDRLYQCFLFLVAYC